MAIKFKKFHGAGNDFILIDARTSNPFSDTPDLPATIHRLCHRNFGIGADGLILIRPSESAAFRMVYYNADGHEGTMCGNGSRCAVAFFKTLGFAGSDLQFETVDGLHHARVLSHSGLCWQIAVQLSDALYHDQLEGTFQINTGSPHLVIYTQDPDMTDVVQQGRLFRYDKQFGEQGVNVNFVSIRHNNQLYVRTYERGVENETLSCGTGVTASAMGAWHAKAWNDQNTYTVITRGGHLQVSFDPPNADKKMFTNVWLTGPAAEVFSGELPG